MPRTRIFVDTSAWYAFIDKNDRDHTAAVKKIQVLDRPLLTSNYVLDEILTLLKTRLGPSIAISFGQKLWDQEVSATLHHRRTETLINPTDLIAPKRLELKKISMLK